MSAPRSLPTVRFNHILTKSTVRSNLGQYNYADDFTKIKKGKDRFNASNKDMQHVVATLGSNFLISNDVKFRKKAIACFAYDGFTTVVCNPKDFIKQCCKFVKP